MVCCGGRTVALHLDIEKRACIESTIDGPRGGERRGGLEELERPLFKSRCWRSERAMKEWRCTRVFTPAARRPLHRSQRILLKCVFYCERTCSCEYNTIRKRRSLSGNVFGSHSRLHTALTTFNQTTACYWKPILGKCFLLYEIIIRKNLHEL